MFYTIANKYQIIEQIGEGSFGKVFRGKHIRTEEEIAIKIQYKSIVNVLQHEAKIYKQLFNIDGIPILRNYGYDQGFHYLIIEQLDKQLDKVEIDKTMCIKYFIQALKIIEDIHKIGILHRDIKPDNFMIKEKNNELFLIDFGLSKRFVDISGNHIEEKTGKKMIGTIKYASLNIHNGLESTRRDDIESLTYTFISLFGVNLPWDELCNNLKKSDSQQECINEIKEKKSSLELLFNIPGEFLTIILYSRNLKFTDAPNYIYIKNLLENFLLL